MMLPTLSLFGTFLGRAIAVLGNLLGRGFSVESIMATRLSRSPLLLVSDGHPRLDALDDLGFSSGERGAALKRSLSSVLIEMFLHCSACSK